MGIFRNDVTLETLNRLSKGTLIEHLEIVFTSLGEDYMEARMPVDHRTHQPLGMLHGGASVALAETLGSMAANSCIDSNTHFCVGLEINANHVRSVRDGAVTGITKPVHMGKKTQVWEIKIQDETSGELVCISRITLAVLEKRRG